MQELGPYSASFRVRLNELEAAKTPLHALYGLRFIKRGIAGIQDVNVLAAIATFEQTPLEKQDMYELLRILELKSTQWKEVQKRAGKMGIGASGSGGDKKTKSQKKQEAQVRQQAAAILQQYQAGYAASSFQKRKFGKGHQPQQHHQGKATTENQFDANGTPLCKNCKLPGHKFKDCRKPGGGAY